MAPSYLFVNIRMIVVAKLTPTMLCASNVCLIFLMVDVCVFSLWEVVGDKCCANLEVRWVTNAIISGDASLELFMVVGESVLEHDISCFLRSEGEEWEVFVQLRFGKGHEFMLSSCAVIPTHKCFENVECIFMADDLSLDV